MTRTHARSARGQRAVCTKAKVERENITLAGLLGPDGIKSLYPYAGSFDGERYLSHLENHLLPCLTAGDFVVMDNLRMHHIPAAKKMFHDAEIELIFLPPYSPEYNPIEEAWSLIKSVLKKNETKNISQYIDALNEARNSLTAEKTRGFYQHAGYTLPN